MPITRRRRANPPDQPEDNNHLAEQSAENSTELSSPEQAMSTTPAQAEHGATFVAERPEADAYQPFVSPPLSTGNDRVERQEYMPSIEPGRRTARGELFRRVPQLPSVPQNIATSVTPVVQVPQPPSHEISLPLGNLLHLAYNPGYTASDDARSILLRQLAAESKAGGRARCWNCGSVAIAYECWNIHNGTFGEIGIAFCEICGVWSVM